jgi:hypothetical protein
MINKEDKADVARHLGKALANKVHKVTDDSKMGKYIPEITRKSEKQMFSSIKKKGYYASPAAKKAIDRSAKEQDAYAKERTERYKREGLS